MKFAGICLVTEDVPALRDFYARLLGVEAVGDDVHAELKTTPTGMAIFSAAGMESMAPGCMEAGGIGSVTLMFEVEEVEAEYGRVQEMGLEVVKPLMTHPWGSRSFWFRDPDGNLVDFYGKAPAQIDENERDILRNLQTFLRMIGDANDAEDHGFLDEAEQERKTACASIQEMMTQHGFIVDLLPTLPNELDSGHILTYGWAELFGKVNAFLPI